MAWAVKLDKQEFIGRAALHQLAVQRPNQNLVGFVMNGGSLPEDGAAILVDGELAGRVTSVRYSPVNRKAVGLAWVPTELAREGAEVDVRVNGRLVRARITQQAFYDPDGARLRL